MGINRGGDGRREDGGKRGGKRGANVLHFLGKVIKKSNKVKSSQTKSSAVREGGVRREENMENSFLGLETEELILVR